MLNTTRQSANVLVLASSPSSMRLQIGFSMLIIQRNAVSDEHQDSIQKSQNSRVGGMGASEIINKNLLINQLDLVNGNLRFRQVVI